MRKKSYNKPIIITIIAVILLCTIALISAGDRTVSWFESAVGTVFTPMQSLASSVSNGIIGFFGDLFNTTDADKENEQLKARIAQLEVASAELDELRLENERLKELLNYSETSGETEYVTASVIANSGNVWFDMFTLNAGRNQGISAGDPVVCADGLVGIVSDVGATWCKVRSVIDAESSVGTLVERTRDNCFIRGVLTTGTQDDTLELYFLPSGSDLVPGDTIVTNGLGSEQIPKGLIVGTVTEVMRTTGIGTSEKNAVVTPAVDFLHLESVMVLTGNGGED